MARTKYDPLEAAKIGPDGEKPKAPPSAEFKSEEVTKEETPAPVAAPRPQRAPLYRVLDLARISIDGQICVFRKDDIIDSAGYGAERGIARLTQQGLKVEQVRD